MYYEKPGGVSVHDGFPNPATDASLQGVDLNKMLVRNGASTYFMRILGNDWQDSGIFDADIILIDRALAPRKTDLVVWWYDGSFAVSPHHQLPEGSEVWGVITTAIHPYRNKT
ncbi:MAG TPA: S24 family peptidase [Verrucomicrobiae bacterium]|nr:S24 family peptidase [Verrucomicrobiae bacterium]